MTGKMTVTVVFSVVANNYFCKRKDECENFKTK